MEVKESLCESCGDLWGGGDIHGFNTAYESSR